MVIPLWVKIDFFLADRAVGYIKDQGYSTLEAEAVIYLSSNPAEYISRLKAIRKTQLMFPEEFASLANSDKRARNILSKSGGQSEVLLTDEKLCVETAEKTLLNKTRELRAQVDILVKAGNFEDALLVTVHVSNPVAAFFDSVMVNAEDDKLRLNRFRLLHEVTGLTNRVADISKLAT
jgi:glycyl-tRNA synthetase beta chain